MNSPTSSLKPFFILWSGQALSLLGSQAVQFALIWWLTQRTGSATVLATASLLGLLPQVVLGPAIGTLVDRWSRKRVMLIADGAVALASLVLAALFLTGQATAGHVFVILFARALGSAFHAPAMLASTSLMVPGRHLTRIQGLNQMLQGGLTIVGAPLGALLFGLLSMGRVMLVDVVSAVAAIVPLVFIAVPRPTGSAAGARTATFLSDLAAGFRYLGQRRGHLALLTMAAVINMCLVPAFSLLPLLVLDELNGDAVQLGWLNASLGIGVVAGGILLGVFGGFRRRILTTLSALVALGIAVGGLAFAPSVSLAATLGAMLAVGLVVPSVNGPIQAIMQATVAPDFQGRVFTLMGSLAGITAPLGLMLAAPVAEIIGVRSWYLLGGAVCSGMGILSFFLPAILRIEETSPVPAAAPVEAART